MSNVEIWCHLCGEELDDTFVISDGRPACADDIPCTERVLFGAVNGRRHTMSDEPIETECEHCCERKLCFYGVDPFLADIYPEAENPPSWWCSDCHSNRADER